MFTIDERLVKQNQILDVLSASITDGKPVHSRIAWALAHMSAEEITHLHASLTALKNKVRIDYYRRRELRLEGKP